MIEHVFYNRKTWEYDRNKKKYKKYKNEEKKCKMY